MAATPLGPYNFPDAYYNNLVASATTVKYVSASGSDSNNGNTVTTPYLTIAQALSATSATATTVTIVILAGTYSITPQANGSTYGTSAITDSNKPRVFVGCPGQVKIQFTNASGYGPYAVDFQNSGSACYGIIFERNNAGKTNSYEVAVFCGSATVGNLKGNFYNCAFTETNANGLWSLQYDNEGRIASQVNNCTFKFGATALADYSGSTGLNVNYCVFNQANPGGSSTKSNTLYSQTVNATTYAVSGVTTSGVYSGTYAWNGTISPTLSTAVVSGTTGSPSTSIYADSGTSYRYYAFTSSGTITFSTGGNVDILTIAGGGAGSSGTLGGGGGAGGLLLSTSVAVSAATYTITVGAGAASSTGVGTNGSNTVVSGTGITTITAIGGGAGGCFGGASNTIGQNGGSGGGGTYYPTTTGGVGVYPGSTYLSQTRQGYDGGVGRNFSTGAGTGGGGGAGAVGAAAGANDPGPSGAGGAGLQLNYNGSNIYYAGGGGGGGYGAGGDIGGAGGLGGGGAGSGVVNGTSDTSRGATAPAGSTAGSGGTNTGGGGGGAYGSGNSGAGGSGLVIIRYSVQPVGLNSSAASVVAGANLIFTLYSANTGNIPYTISGITSDIINNAALTGNFVMSGGSATANFTVKPLLTTSYTMSMTADGYTSNVILNPNVSISTSVTSIGYSSSTSSLISPINGQLNIPDVVVTPSQYDKGGSIQSTFPIAGQMNIIDNIVTTTDPTLSTKTLLPMFSNLLSNTVLPYTTITTSTAGPLQQGVIKLFGDNPNREYWM